MYFVCKELKECKASCFVCIHYQNYKQSMKKRKTNSVYKIFFFCIYMSIFVRKENLLSFFFYSVDKNVFLCRQSATENRGILSHVARHTFLFEQVCLVRMSSTEVHLHHEPKQEHCRPKTTGKATILMLLTHFPSYEYYRYRSV